MMEASSLASNAMHLHSYFSLLCAKWTRDASALRWRPESRTPPFGCRVVSWVFSPLPCFRPFYSSSPKLKGCFFTTFFPSKYVNLWEGGSPPAKLIHVCNHIKPCITSGKGWKECYHMPMDFWFLQFLAHRWTSLKIHGHTCLVVIKCCGLAGFQGVIVNGDGEIYYVETWLVLLGLWYQ